MHVTISGQPTYLYTGGKDDAAQQALPPLLFLHGAQQDHSCWALQSRWFGHHGYRVLAPDLPAHGRSGGEPLPSVEALADWAVALLDSLGIAQVRLVGHSMGSLIGLELARRYPERVQAAALIGSALPMPVAEPLLAAADSNEAKAAAMINAWSYSPRGMLGRSAAPGLWLLGMNTRLMARQRRGVLPVDLRACNAYVPDPASLAAVRCPVQLLAGEKDRMTPLKAGKALAALLPQAQLQVIPEAGHAMMAEAPDAVLDALREFFARH
ncbi:MAG: hypothetical protein RIR00_2080 [Pseudomonadota bacterium]|jgi:pimeloyl-ACP methyl ester carboxylesterase